MTSIGLAALCIDGAFQAPKAHGFLWRPFWGAAFCVFRRLIIYAEAIWFWPRRGLYFEFCYPVCNFLWTFRPLLNKRKRRMRGLPRVRRFSILAYIGGREGAPARFLRAGPSAFLSPWLWLSGCCFSFAANTIGSMVTCLTWAFC